MAKLLYQGNNLTAVSSDADYLKYDNTTSGLTATNAQGAIDEVALAAKAINNRVLTQNDFTISTAWESNTDIGDFESYPYKQTIATTNYTDNSSCDCLVFGANPSSFMTEAEREAKSLLCEEVMFTSSYILVLASDKTETALTLRVKGV